MIDTYLKSKDPAALDELRGFVMNAIGPTQGMAAIAAGMGEFGVQPAQPAKGDPLYWYLCVRAPFPIQPYGAVEACDTQEGIDVLGVGA